MNESINSSNISTNDNKISQREYQGHLNNNHIGAGTGGDISTHSSRLDPMDD